MILFWQVSGISLMVYNWLQKWSVIFSITSVSDLILDQICRLNLHVFRVNLDDLLITSFALIRLCNVCGRCVKDYYGKIKRYFLTFLIFLRKLCLQILTSFYQINFTLWFCERGLSLDEIYATKTNNFVYDIINVRYFFYFKKKYRHGLMIFRRIPIQWHLFWTCWKEVHWNLKSKFNIIIFRNL